MMSAEPVLAGRRAGILGLLIVALLLCCGQVRAAGLEIGPDLPFRTLEDRSGQLGVDEFEARAPELPLTRQMRSLGYVRSALWVGLQLPARVFAGEERWLQLGPNYLDHVTVYYRVAGSHDSWTRRDTGDVTTGPIGDLDYRFAVFRLLPPPARSAGYEIAIRVQTTSAVLLLGSVWSPEAFLAQAARSTSFWSFYLGAVAVITTLALVFALVLRRAVMWAVCSFSIAYLLLACLQGYVDWWLGRSVLHLQHYLASVGVLLSNSAGMWMCAEAVELRRHLPRVYRAVIGIAALNVLLLLSIPLDFYGFATGLQAILFFVSALAFSGCVMRLWWRGESGAGGLIVGFLPLAYVASAVLSMLSLRGMIAWYDGVSQSWQYLMAINMVGVFGAAVWQVHADNLALTEKQQLVRELAIEREASSHQRQFIGMVSHEFRTPLSVISASLENLGVTDQSEEQRRHRHDKIRRATERLVQLTDNCLADARLSAETLHLELKPTDILDLVRSTVEQCEIVAPHSLQLTLEGRPAAALAGGLGQPRWLVDAGLLRIALFNLLDNALKYSHAGALVVDVRLQDDRGSLSVEDPGPGIPHGEEQLVFERYRRASTTRVRGTGLGLYVARQVARAHGGDLILAANGREGCRFELQLPVHAVGSAI